MTAAEKRTIRKALNRFELIAGAGSEDTKQACAMTMLAWVAGREWTDAPPCAHRILRDRVISVNDKSDTTPEMRAAIVKAGEHGILDTWWVPDLVIAAAFELRKGDSDKPYDRLLRALARVAKWKLDKGLPPDLSAADLSGAVLESADLRSADLRSADLGNAVLSGADLESAVLSGADLSGAILRSAVLRSADLSGAILRSADLRGARGEPYTGMPSGWKLSSSGLWVKA